MSKIKFKLKSVCTTYVKDTKGKLYKLNPGLNTLELDYDDYVSLSTALGIHVKHSSDNVDKDSSESSKLNDRHVEEYDQQSTVKDIADDVVKDAVDSVVKDAVDSTSNNDTTDESDTETNGEVDDDLDNSDIIDYSSWSYNKRKSEYKKITGTNCRLKKGDVIAFLQEHSNV